MSTSHYIFLSDEGSTFEPFSNTYIPELENLQVLGIASGETQEEAFQNLLKESSDLVQSDFNRVIGYKLDSDYITTMKLHNINSFRSGVDGRSAWL